MKWPLMTIAAFTLALSGLAAQREPPSDPILRIQQQLDGGQLALTFAEPAGYLRSVLAALDVPISSQTLVFSRTSLEIFLISPQTPRALYFNDGVYVGFIQGGHELEVATLDPHSGPVFYTLGQTPTPTPRFKRDDITCLHCHVIPPADDSRNGAPSLSPPRFFMRSHFVDREGNAFQATGQALIFQTTDQAPLGQRWGGWYVTGTHGDQRHMGNMHATESISTVGPNLAAYAAKMDRSKGANVIDLRTRLDTTPYLTPHSDIVALMVLAHQVTVQNLIVDAANAAGDEVAVKRAGERLVKAMLFSGEAQLTSPVKGTTTFATDFAAQEPRDQRGRSLRDFDLQRRLFRYPLSYLIYSASFDALPRPVKQYVYRRLREVLDGSVSEPEFDHLSASDRAAILAIVEETKPDFAR